jgi:hypothetical protein
MNNTSILAAVLVALSGCAGIRVQVTPPLPRIDSIAVGELVMDHYDIKRAKHQRSAAFPQMLQIANAARDAGTRVVEGGGVPVITGEIRWSIVDEWVSGITSAQTHFYYVQYDLVLKLRDAKGRGIATVSGTVDGTVGLTPLEQLLRDATRSLLEEVRRANADRFALAR